MSNSIIVENHGAALVIIFNRPEIRNPLSVSILKNLHEIFDRMKNQTKIETVIFTGKENIFASGANLREIAEIPKNEAGEFALRGQSLMNKIAAADQTTIAAINGFCFGGALDLALACDKRIAAANASFSHPGANLGIITGWGGTQRLPLLIGEAKALEMFLTAKRVNAAEALQLGLIDKIAENPVSDSLANFNTAGSSKKI